MIIYDTFERVDCMQPCVKLPIVIHSLQIHEPFRVKSLEGNYKQGKAGDYLMRGIDGELYICDKLIYERTYQSPMIKHNSWQCQQCGESIGWLGRIMWVLHRCTKRGNNNG